MTFGDSSIGTTVQENIYDFGVLLKRISSNLPEFVSAARFSTQDFAYKLSEKLKNIEDLISKQTEKRSTLKTKTREVNFQLKIKMEKDPDVDKNQLELCAHAASLHNAIKRIGEIHKEMENLKAENDKIQEEINKKQKVKDPDTEVESLNQEITQLRFDISEYEKQHREVLSTYAENNQKLQKSIPDLERRIKDLNYRINVFVVKKRVIPKFPLVIRPSRKALPMNYIEKTSKIPAEQLFS